MSFSTRDGQLEPAAEVAAPVAPFEAGDVGREREAARVGVDDAGNADDDAVDPVGREPARLGERDAKPGDRLDRALGVGAVELDVLARADLAAQVADRAAQEAGAEVETEHERRLGDELEEGGAVGRPAGIGVGLADEAGLEQVLERQRDGRLRDPGAARDLGPRDRRTGADRIEDGALVQILQQRWGSRRFGPYRKRTLPVAAGFSQPSGDALDFRRGEVQSRVSKLN